MEWITRCPSKDSKAIFRIIDDQTMAIRIDDKPVGRDNVYIFNSTGTRIWELLDGKRNVEEIIKIIYDEFEIDYKKAEKEVIGFITDLLKKHLITV